MTGKTPPHPGTITYVDGDTDEVIATDDAAELPDSLRYADTKKGMVPVVKVVKYQADNQRFIREYGPDGELLRSTVQRRDEVSA